MTEEQIKAMQEENEQLKEDVRILKKNLKFLTEIYSWTFDQWKRHW